MLSLSGSLFSDIPIPANRIALLQTLAFEYIIKWCGYCKQEGMESWINYFTITGSIASGLTGLIFVGLSVNLKKIFCITKAHLPSRALGSLVLIANIVIVCNLCIVPQQPVRWLGIEILFLAITIWVTISRLDFITYRRVDHLYKKHYFRNLFFVQLSILPFLVAGICMIGGSPIAYYILVPGILFSLIKSLLDVWFLTVEINK